MEEFCLSVLASVTAAVLVEILKRFVG